MVSSFFTMCCMGNVEMSDGDYANVEDFPLINAEQPEPVARRLGGVVVLILLYESESSSSSRQTRPRCPVKHLWVQPSAATSNIGPRVIGSQRTEEWPLVRRPLELLNSYIDASGTKSTSMKINKAVIKGRRLRWFFLHLSQFLGKGELWRPAGPPYPCFQCLVHAVVRTVDTEDSPPACSVEQINIFARKSTREWF